MISVLQRKMSTMKNQADMEAKLYDKLVVEQEHARDAAHKWVEYRMEEERQFIKKRRADYAKGGHAIWGHWGLLRLGPDGRPLVSFSVNQSAYRSTAKAPQKAGTDPVWRPLSCPCVAIAALSPIAVLRLNV
jgi:hypothetical protein